MDPERIKWTGNDYQANSIITFIRGGHNLRTGFELVRMQLFELAASQSRGRFTFQGRKTSTSADTAKQEPYADFLMGYIANSYRRLNSITDYVFATTFGSFVQDDWKIGRNLTLNLGVRYELLMPPTEKFGQWTNFVPEVGRTVISGEPGFPKALVYSEKNNFAPRVGLAWRPMGSKHTSIRTGYGIFYGMNLLGDLHASLGTNAPFTVLESYSGANTDPLSLSFLDPFPSGRAASAGVTQPKGTQLHPTDSYLQNYNFTIERQVGGATLLEIGYVGSKGTHLSHQWDINQPFRGPDLPRPFARPFPQYSTIQYFSYDAISNYNALQASVRTRRKRLNMRLNYTFAKSIDEGSNMTGPSNGGFIGLQDSRNRGLERGLSDFDRRHAFVASAIYELPAARWAKALTGGWQVSTILRAYAGTPITPQSASANTDNGESKRPDRTGSGRLASPRRELWFNVNDFQTIAPGSYRFGNTGRNIVPGPGRMFVDFSLMKSFRVAEGQRLQFRAEIFNAPNHTNFLTPNPNIDVPTGGVISGALNARQVQATLKYSL